MLKVADCFAGSHDQRLVVLAVAVCVVASCTGMQLYWYSGLARGRRSIWVGIAAAACGSGIWATHFIAMLAYAPGLATAYDIPLTILSLGVAIGMTGCGLAVALRPGVPRAAWIGGGLIGLGIAIMHYTGMAAYRVVGHLVWSPWLVAVSIGTGMTLGGAALAIAAGQPKVWRQLSGTAMLVLAISGLHFIGMAAVTIVPDPTILVTASAVPASWLAIAVALVSLVVLICAGAAVALHQSHRRAVVEADRLRSLANAAFEGLLICRVREIASANDSFATLVGTRADVLSGMSLSGFLSNEAMRQALDVSPLPVETGLTHSDGSVVPVELIARPIRYAGEAHYAVAVRDIRARRTAERQIAYLGQHDELTGLANRTSLALRLEQAILVAAAKRGMVAVLSLDLDRFKSINDFFGQAVGDAMLCKVARLIGGALGETQVAGRSGGDEFTVLAHVDHAVAAGRLAERILDALRADPQSSTEPPITASIGISLYPDNTSDHNHLFTQAETALARAKSEGGGYCFYEERMGADVRSRRSIEHDLRHAVERGQMHVAYQPQSRTQTGEVVGFEALLRWSHDQRGDVPPSVFIPIAEETGLILDLGEWVMRESCREAASWTKPLTLAVNVSAVQLHSPRFVDALTTILRETGMPPARLEIEVTETAVVRDPDRALSALREVKALGVRVAIDDFGTGYSSLSNLRLFPIDKIKIDRSFVTCVESNDQTAAIVRSVLGLGRGLGLPVIAEGVETAAELEFLRAEGCTQVQGYYIGRPAPIAVFSDHTGLLRLAPLTSHAA